MNAKKQFFDYIEIRTKTASLLPFLTALAYCFYLGGSQASINVRSSVLFFTAMLLFDFTTNMINNYIDFCEENATWYLKRWIMLAMLFFALVSATGIGLYLVWLHGLTFFLSGVFCFAIGIGYSFGPMPICKSSYGEICAGIAMGFMIPFLLMEINAPGIIKITFDGMYAQITIDPYRFMKLALVCVPVAFSLANITFANNISDIEKDRADRYTLPRHIGIKNSLRVFNAAYIVLYIAIVLACVLRILPWTCLFVLLTAIPVYKNAKQFNIKQEKNNEDGTGTFVLTIINFVIIVIPYIVCIFIGALI